MLGKSLKNYTFYLHQTKLIRRFSLKYLLLVLKTPIKDHLVRAVLLQLDREGRSKPCEGETFEILKGPLDCNSNSVKNISLNSLM